MTTLHVLGVALGAGLGAVCRAATDRTVMARVGPTRLPWATLAVNVAGSFLLGFVLVWPWGSPETIRVVLGTGFAGGLTTFSTFSVESFQLIREGRPRGAFAYAGLTVVLGMAAVILGDLAGSALG